MLCCVVWATQFDEEPFAEAFGKKLKHQPGSSESPRKAGCHPGGCCPRTFSGIGAWGIRALGS